MTAPVAWITGGGTGIGRALAQALCRQGYRVAITGRRVEVLQEAARQIRSIIPRGEILPLAGDVTHSASMDSVYAVLQQRWGNPDLLINNAGQHSHDTFDDTSPETYLRLLDVNFLSTVRCTHKVLPEMRQKGRGAIVNVSSIYGRWASADSVAYSVSKYAVAGFTDGLRQELGRTGIHVMGVFPGFIRTDMTDPFLKPGSIKAFFGAAPDQLAQAVLRGLKRRQPEVCYPWYVPWAWRFHRWMPTWSDAFAQRFRHG
ncbi:MAG: SDR family NAD(P)-dependent oxidoreductase [Elusimicrobiota bacterium]|jgi:hypothetical protein